MSEDNSKRTSVIRKEVQRLFYVLGFAKAMHWSDDKLREMVNQLVLQIPLERVPEKHRELYQRLEQLASKGEYIVWTRGIRKSKKMKL